MSADRLAEFRSGWQASTAGQPESVLQGTDALAGFKAAAAGQDVESAAAEYVRRTAPLSQHTVEVDEDGLVILRRS